MKVPKFNRVPSDPLSTSTGDGCARGKRRETTAREFTLGTNRDDGVKIFCCFDRKGRRLVDICQFEVNPCWPRCRTADDLCDESDSPSLLLLPWSLARSFPRKILFAIEGSLFILGTTFLYPQSNESDVVELANNNASSVRLIMNLILQQSPSMLQ